MTPQPSATAEPTAPPLSAVDQQATATAQALAEEEARMQEIAEVVKENENTFTIEELNAYLAKKGWSHGVDSLINPEFNKQVQL